jgi:hypothetical protein
MKSTCFLKYICPRPEKEVIRIAQYDPGAHFFLQLLLGHCFHTSHGTYRHKNGRWNFTMIRGDGSSPCPGAVISAIYGE